ncbi:uncharacterized protein TNCV_869971 [Trichonephila clavipes]|nr:uncharacterized protein TNCV_869971 [Trichonephila clavipes]
MALSRRNQVVTPDEIDMTKCQSLELFFMNSVASTLNRVTGMEFNNQISGLTQNNWNTWKHDMQVLLMHYGCWQFIIQTNPEQPDEEATYMEKLDLQLRGAAARIFCGLMNLPPPPAKFERHNSLFLNVLKTISEDSMNAAVHEAVIANDNNSNIAVAVDGTWHKRGYSSLNGVVCATSVENGKVIDFEALTKYCSSYLSEQQEALMVEVTIPNCYKQAIRSRDASKWHDAMDKKN